MKGARNARLRHQMHRLRFVGLAVQGKAAAVGRIQTRDDIEKSGFASAVRADQPIDFTAPYVQTDIGQRLQTAKALRRAADA